MLSAIWNEFYPQEDFCEISVLWKGCGFQREDPVSDVRGGGELSLSNLLYLLRNYSGLCTNMAERQRSKRHATAMEKGYPFAAACINTTRMLAQVFHIIKPSGASGDYATTAQVFWQMLDEPDAFNKLFVVAFVLLDSEFVGRDASYMEFNEVMESCKTKLVRALQGGDGKGGQSIVQVIATLGLHRLMSEHHEERQAAHQTAAAAAAAAAATSTSATATVSFDTTSVSTSHDLLGLEEWTAACGMTASGMVASGSVLPAMLPLAVATC
jgi:hypothetical protein